MLVPIHEYRPGLTVRVVDRLPAPITVQLLRLPNGTTVPELTQPDEYAGYVARTEPGADRVRSTMIVFTRGSLETDACYTFEADVQVFNTQLHLFETAVSRIASAGDACNVPQTPEQR
ncbi:hypothetical protein [Natrinema sp. 1APR25-10V2]|uniref:hypothetical protein n=1 Tax=Natrinema sp. 1APR25-10V2 TaxID=2951081 RepID=UPI0028740D68|nr:hypothetical protein [Natrinema sp. 1APR25-10V2]MDS0478433.1 hypothetical protein [Natrinema sp. 1APR25-10V2]